jgi:Flp pilus assembly protein TadD
MGHFPVETMRSSARNTTLLRSTAVAAMLVALAACKTTSDPDITGSISATPTVRSDADWRRAADTWGERYRRDQKDPQAAINYAQALRATEQRAQAVAVLEQASMANPQNKGVLGAYGRALADVGRYQQAMEVLNKAHTPDQPDWRILNVMGAVFDQTGNHAEARRHYSSALKIKPDDPSVLSNLGLSYALSNELKRAEETLRRASIQPGAAPKVRQNLALVIGLQGRFAEAESMVRADLPKDEAEANVAYLKEMLAQHSERLGDSKPAAPRPRKRAKSAMPQPDTGAGT